MSAEFANVKSFAKEMEEFQQITRKDITATV